MYGWKIKSITIVIMIILVHFTNWSVLKLCLIIVYQVNFIINLAKFDHFLMYILSFKNGYH